MASRRWPEAPSVPASAMGNHLVASHKLFHYQPSKIALFCLALAAPLRTRATASRLGFPAIGRAEIRNSLSVRGQESGIDEQDDELELR